MGHEVPRYSDVFASFSAEKWAAELAGDLRKGINPCIECCDRYADSDRVALRYEDKDARDSTILTYRELVRRSHQLALFLKEQGIKPGDRVACMLPRIPALLVCLMGIWRLGAVFQPMFTAFGPKAIEHRVRTAETKFIITDTENRPKLDEVPDCPPIAIVLKNGEERTHRADLDFRAEVDRQAGKLAPALFGADDPIMMMFTSGTTGLAKGVPVPAKAILSFLAYTRYSVDLRPDDSFWSIADPGWAYGLYYGVIGPMMQGNSILFYDGAFTVDSAYQVLDKYKVTNLIGAPTAYRLLIAAGADRAKFLKGRLRVVSSAGETLNPKVIEWFREHLNCNIHDHYGQTETGMLLGNHHGLAHPVRMGSAGLAVPGYRAAVVDEQGNELPAGKPGILATDRSRSSLAWFQGYWKQPTKIFVGNYQLTGDTVELNDDGSISFLGRDDDIITSAGYRIGPYEVESALIEHEAVMESACVGKPDPERTEVVKAFVVLKNGYEPNTRLAEELQQFVKRRLSAHAYPREVEFTQQLPKTASGKIQRFLLRDQEISKAAAKR